MNINFFFFTLFQNFMVPLDSSWWDLFKSAIAPQFTFLLPSLFGTYLWIFFIFTSVPILKKSCCRKNQIFAQNHLPQAIPLGLPIVFDDGEWINFCLFLVYYYCLWWENITLYKTCRKNKIAALKVQITNILWETWWRRLFEQLSKWEMKNWGGSRG